MRFGVLGPLVIMDDTGTVHSITAARHRTVLAVLLLRANQIVSFDELADVVWDGNPPPGARPTLRNYVKLLRQRLGPAGARLHTQPPGYRLEVHDSELDLDRFTRHAANAGQAARSGDWTAAAREAAAALDLWRGRPLADVDAPTLHRDAAGPLQERRVQMLEERIEADLRLGNHAGLAAELERLVAEHPLRELLWAQLMRALAAAGQRAAALAAYRQAREVLVAELGLEPGPGLQAVQQQILADTVASPAQLPLDVPGFVGRGRELAELDATLAPGSGQPATVVISAVSGTAGVGKTALAIHWAHRVADRFPDGQLYLNLRGFDPAGVPVPPIDAVQHLLEALDVPPQRIPLSLAARSSLLRSVLAGRRLLLVLDNAADEEQVRPLLPGAPGVVALITSRNRLDGLIAAQAARPLRLDLLTAGEAHDLLAGRLGSGRIAAERQAADEIIDRCARLPLALAIAAARVAIQPDGRLSTVAGELRAARAALDAFAGRDAATDVRSVFSWSYRALHGTAARLFRLVGAHPGPSVSLPALASMAGVPIGQVRPDVEELVSANLLTRSRTDRFSQHDLLRAYAGELATDEPDGLRRIMDHALHSAHSAAVVLRPLRDPLDLPAVAPGVVPELIADADAAKSWFDAERAVLLQLIRVPGFPLHVWRLAWAVSEYLERRGQWHDVVGTQLAARDAALHTGDRLGQVHALRALGMGYVRLGRFDEANHNLREALAVAAALDDPAAQARVHNNHGWVMEVQGRYPEAIGHAVTALALYRELGHRPGQANALNNIGWYHALAGDHVAAIRYCEQAMAVMEDLGDTYGQAAAWDSLGYANHQLGRHQRAIACYRQAVKLFTDAGNRYHEAATLSNLGDTYDAIGDHPAAASAWQRALTVFEELGHPDAAGVRDKVDAAAER